ncbi:MAG: hypothetical protein AAGD10_20795 [Myxococcota bacterium]
MGVNPFTLALLLCGILVVSVLLVLRRPSRLFTSLGTRIPRQLTLAAHEGPMPIDVRAPVEYLGDRLSGLGFQALNPVMRLPDFERLGHRLLLFAHHHPQEHALFLMAIESGLVPDAQLMLHVLTPLDQGRRLETTTLAALGSISSPKGVTLTVALDVDRVEELWHRHRRGLASFERSERRPPSAADWPQEVAEVYASWLQAGVRAHRLVLDGRKARYRLRAG